MASVTCTKIVFVAVVFIGALLEANCIDLNYSDITVVTDDTRYEVLNPDVMLDPFEKIRHVKGNIFFSRGKRLLAGDRVLVNFLDTEKFSAPVDVEVYLRFPAEGNGPTITMIEVLVDLTSDDADTSFISGGIAKSFAEILIACNGTTSFTYEIFIYGY